MQGAITQENNKRIAKNTLMLYFRMLLMMLVSLYTSRVVLATLGVTDYGIYNVVGGIVAMLGFLNGSMSNAVQRYLSFEIGKNNPERVNRIFNVSLLVHAGIAAIVLIVMEILGVWYLNTHMNIPEDRLAAANWVLQCSILTTLFSIMQVPYNAIIIAKEQMGIYAYISILEAILKLAIVFLLNIWAIDKLKLYSVLTMFVIVSILMLYQLYCMKKYNEAKFKFVKDIKLFKELIGFAGWNMLEELAWIFSNQGINIMLNVFFGPAINSARGLAMQVNDAVTRFVTNFQTAVNPQLIKYYATEELEQMKNLLYRSTRFSYYLILILSLPIIFNIEFILNIWLKEVPQYTSSFCKLVLIYTLIFTNSRLLSQIARAYGKIRNYQIIVAIILFLNFPISYIFLKAGASPLSTMYVSIGIQVILLYVRLLITGKMINMTVLQFFTNAIMPIISVTFSSIILPVILSLLLDNSFLSFIISVLATLLSTALSIFFLGMNKNEKKFLLNKIIIKQYKK